MPIIEYNHEESHKELVTNEQVYRMLNSILIKHYDCFNRERFYLDVLTLNDGFCSVVTSSIQDTCPVPLCKGIAKFIKKTLRKLLNGTKFSADNFKNIYVGAWVIKVDNL